VCRGLVIQGPARHELCPASGSLESARLQNWSADSLVRAHAWHEMEVKSGLDLHRHPMRLGKICSVGDCSLNQRVCVRIETIAAQAGMLSVLLCGPVGSRLRVKQV